MSTGARAATRRHTSYETFESRIVFSVDPVVGNVAGDTVLQAEIDDPAVPAQYSLADAHAATGAEYVFADYGFDGAGQTVAVIDSGIAWDHYALGGGLGDQYRVVGGWDFAEGDANPYDDGPAGFHGTHVAGIIGSDDTSHRGVAPGVDLVGLRVFDDQGTGNIAWVEQALQWVHEHRNDFANPITTVNLSLGVDWNSDFLPGWATLEDEFAQLEADNIFISVAAGNAFKKYDAAGLAYPAVSDHVVPVSSHGADGSFSDFSQRNERVLVAPGESIQSTAPGHLFGNSQSSTFLGASGTSMAAPYVAGASAVLREAMTFMGYENVNQDALYQHFRDTSDQFFDAVTGGYYHRLDLAAAVDAVVTDAHGDAESSATWLGEIGQGDTLHGTIGKLTDVDAFSFTASATGRLEISGTQSHELVSLMKINGQDLQWDGNSASFDVTAGQKYTLSISTAAGIGHYNLEMNIEASQNAIEIGKITSHFLANQSVDGEVWYELTAGRSGLLTSTIANSGLNLEVYDSSMNLISRSTPVDGNLRSDAWVSSGQRYLVRITGHDADFDLSMKNQVSLNADGLLRVFGTGRDDTISLEHQPDQGVLSVLVSDTQYYFSLDKINEVFLDGKGGNDHLSFNFRGKADTLALEANRISGSNADFSVRSGHFSSIDVTGDSTDKLTFLDSVGDDIFMISGTSSSMTGDGFRNTASGFTDVQAISRSGSDTTRITGSEQADRFTINGSRVEADSGQTRHVSSGFRYVDVQAGGGEDSLVIHGRENAWFELRGNTMLARLNQTFIQTGGIESTTAISHGAGGQATLRGTAGNDLLYSTVSETTMSGDGYRNTLQGFDGIVVDATAGGGRDSAYLLDSAGDDRVTGNHHLTQIAVGGNVRKAYGFDSVSVVAENGGHDHAVFSGTRGRDTMYTRGDSTWISGARYQAGLIGFESVVVHGNGGRDGVLMQGDGNNTNFHFAARSALMQGKGYSVTASNFNNYRLDGGGGQNTVSLEGFGEQDQLTAEGSALLAYLDGATVRADNFIWLEAKTDEDQTSEREIGAVDFWYALHGQWNSA